MPNITRERSDYSYELTQEQIKQLLELARRKDTAFEQLVLEAIDQFIARETRGQGKR